MKQVRHITGSVCPLPRADVDTDQIIPKQFLKRIDRAGFGPFAFHGWRYDDAGDPVADFPLNRPEHEGAPVLLTGSNFGCGSSREHAVWALDDAGFEAVVAPSFADIFRNNCTKVGLLTVELEPHLVERLFELVDADPDLRVDIDLEQDRLTATSSEDGAVVFEATFDTDPHTKHRLLHGLDDIGLTLQRAGDIDTFESRRPAWLPRVS